MKLAEWFEHPNHDGSRRRRDEFAKKIDVTPQMISAYCDGRTIPNRARIEQIYRETDGQVAPNDWYDLTVQEGAA
jgi:hypothetical protein